MLASNQLEDYSSDLTKKTHSLGPMLISDEEKQLV